MNKLHQRLIDKGGNYADWHNVTLHHAIHWLAFLVVIVATGFYFVTFAQTNPVNSITTLSAPGVLKKQNSNQDFSKLPEMTAKLLEKSKEYKNADEDTKTLLRAELTDIALARKNLLVQSIEHAPKEAERSALNPSLLNKFPPEISYLLERTGTIKGTFEYLHVHYGEFDTGEPEDLFYIKENSTGKRFQVFIPEHDINALTDDSVEIQGLMLDDKIATHAKSIKVTKSSNKHAEIESNHTHGFADAIESALSPHTKTAAAAATQKKVAVVMVNWQNNTRTAISESKARASYFTAATSTNAYFKENSFNQVELTGINRLDGDVFGWLTIPYNDTDCANNFGVWSNAADSILANQGVNINNYNIISYIFPSNTSCGWSGLGYVGGNPSRSWLNSTNQGVITHEIGHNMGAHHASGWRCTENGIKVSISTDANCLLSEYGDPYDVMGNSTSIRQMNNYHKGTALNSLNWLSPANTFTIDRNTQTNGVYTISPIETVSTGIQSLRIPRLDSTGNILNYYYLEFRQPLGFDKGINSAVTNGVTVRIASDYNSVVRSLLIDTTPETDIVEDAPIAVGRSYTDPFQQINITTQSVSPTGAQVKVSFGASPCTSVQPGLSITPATQAAGPGSSLSYTITVTNKDGASCPAQTFEVIPTLTNGFIQSPTSFITDQITAGASKSYTVTITAPDTIASGNYTITQTAYNTSNTSLNTKATALFTIGILDTTPPTITITKPADNSEAPNKGNLTITATGTDNVGLKTIVLSFDGIELKTCARNESCSVNYQSSKILAGSHTVTATATDTAGNIATTTVTVTK